MTLSREVNWSRSMGLNLMEASMIAAREKMIPSRAVNQAKFNLVLHQEIIGSVKLNHFKPFTHSKIERLTLISRDRRSNQFQSDHEWYPRRESRSVQVCWDRYTECWLRYSNKTLASSQLLTACLPVSLGDDRMMGFVSRFNLFFKISLKRQKKKGEWEWR